MAVKMNLRIITKNHTADPEKEFLTKSISKPFGRATVTPPAWEFNQYFAHNKRIIMIQTQNYVIEKT